MWREWNGSKGVRHAPDADLPRINPVEGSK